jgi:hypothetical protein
VLGGQLSFLTMLTPAAAWSEGLLELPLLILQLVRFIFHAVRLGVLLATEGWLGIVLLVAAVGLVVALILRSRKRPAE